MKALPVTVEELIEGLDKLYPARPPRLSDPDRQVWFDAGARSVVEYLKTLQARLRPDDRLLPP